MNYLAYCNIYNYPNGSLGYLLFAKYYRKYK